MKSIDLSLIRKLIVKELADGYDDFVLSTMRLVEDNFDSYRQVAFEDISEKRSFFSLDIKFCVDFIHTSIDEKELISFGYKADDGYPWFKNEIKFPFYSRIPEPPPFGSASFFKYREWRDDLEYNCERKFWEIEGFRTKYQQFENLNVFDDFLFEKDKLLDFQRENKFYLEKQKWLEFISSLISIFFPEFKESRELSIGSVKRYILPINRHLLFGFEYDESALNYEISKGQPEMPRFFNLILINANVKKGIKGLKHWRADSSDILSLGILGNPFFFPPCYSMIGFCAIDRHRQFESGLQYKREIIAIQEGRYQLIHPRTYNESIKRHAFFYMHLLSFTAAPYIEYLIKSVKRAIRED